MPEYYIAMVSLWWMAGNSTTDKSLSLLPSFFPSSYRGWEGKRENTIEFVPLSEMPKKNPRLYKLFPVLGKNQCFPTFASRSPTVFVSIEQKSVFVN